MLLINEQTVRRIIDEDCALRLAKQVFLLIARGKTGMPPKIYLTLPHGDDFRAMPAYLDLGGAGVACGVKWVSVFPDNPRRGRPTVNAVILLNSSKSGQTLAMVEANAITALRTAATAALATRYLARPHPQKLALVGAGLQAEYQLRALAVRARFSEIAVWAPRPEEAAAFCSRLRAFKNMSAYARLEDCVRGADIITTCTPSRRPLVKKAWVKKGAHINAIGADARGKEELDPALLRDATVVVDAWDQASHSGEINVPVSRGAFTRRDLHAELAAIVAGRKKGRRTAEEITVFDSTGLAVLDIHFAHFVYGEHSKKRA